jgi:hypothetical protein
VVNLGLNKGEVGFLNFSEAPPLFKKLSIFIFLAVNVNFTQLSYVIDRRVLCFFLLVRGQGSRPITFHWLDEFANPTLAYLTTDQFYVVD